MNRIIQLSSMNLLFRRSLNTLAVKLKAVDNRIYFDLPIDESKKCRVFPHPMQSLRMENLQQIVEEECSEKVINAYNNLGYISQDTKLINLIDEPFTIKCQSLEVTFDASEIHHLIPYLNRSTDDNFRIKETNKTELQTKFNKMDTIRKQIDIVARSSINRKLWMYFTLMGFQTGILARWTWWDYSWDVVEPMTYFLAYGTCIAWYSFFLLSHKDLNFDSFAEGTYLRSFYSEACRRGFNVDHYNQLVTQLEDTK
ncbi:hypothetical protein GJ496_001091 [Pomphorhynchus laevis]|nr:hypothetical protein GJ496_001091 [Pomphorhynchus laevis]